MAAPLAIAGFWIAAASTAFSVYSSIQQSRAAKAAAEYNARVAEQAARDAEARGQDDANRIRRRTSVMLGAARAAAGASGAVATEYSPLASYMDILREGELDAVMTENNAFREAWGLRTQAGSFRFSGGASASAAKLNAGALALEGGANLYGRAVVNQTARNEALATRQMSYWNAGNVGPVNPGAQ